MKSEDKVYLEVGTRSGKDLYSLLDSAVQTRTWEQAQVDLDDKDHHPSLYFAEVMEEIRGHLEGLVREGSIGKRQRRLGTDACTELIYNAQRHMNEPFFFRLKLAQMSDATMMVYMENTSTKADFERAFD